MNSQENFEKLEQALVRAGKAITYPPTPAIAVRERQELRPRASPRTAWLPRPVLVGLTAVVITFALLIAFPETREALAQLLGLRTIRIIPVTPTPTLTSPPTPLLRGEGSSAPTPTSPSTPSPVREAGKVQCCETTLADAHARSRFTILLPPSDAPSRVHFQELPNFGPGAQQLILVFGDPNAPRYSLYEATNFLYGKLVSGGTVIGEEQVKGERALWFSGMPHVLVYLDARGQPQFETERTVYANTLAWEMGQVTFRLESNLSKEEAVRLAESLR